jgi:hypothetical protein
MPTDSVAVVGTGSLLPSARRRVVRVEVKNPDPVKTRRDGAAARCLGERLGSEEEWDRRRAAVNRDGDSLGGEDVFYFGEEGRSGVGRGENFKLLELEAIFEAVVIDEAGDHQNR